MTPIDTNKIQSYLNCPDRYQINYLESCVSTNQLAIEQIGEGHGTIFITDHQTSGRGRRNNQWHATARTSLLFSIILESGWPRSAFGWIPLIAGLAVTKAIEVSYPDLVPKIKWPNDIWLHNKKVCGILAENPDQNSEAIVLGIGINVLSKEDDLHKEVKETATSLAIETDQEVERESLAVSIINHLEDLFTKTPQELTSDIEGRLLWKDHFIKCMEGNRAISGYLRGLAEFGELKIETNDGQLLKIVQALNLALAHE